jgi:hypothetical protein
MLDGIIVEMTSNHREQPLTFAIIRTTYGIYSGNITRNHTLPTPFIVSYYAYMNIDYQTPENAMKNELEQYLIANYDGVERPIVDDRLRLFNGKTFKVKVFKEFMNWYEYFKGEKYSYQTVYIRPDFRIHHKGKTFLLELECTNHNEGDFYWKLLRLHALDKKIVFIFNDDTYDYHIELIANFERLTGRRFRYLSYCRYSEFIMLGNNAFINHRQVSI